MHHLDKMSPGTIELASTHKISLLYLKPGLKAAKTGVKRIVLVNLSPKYTLTMSSCEGSSIDTKLCFQTDRSNSVTNRELKAPPLSYKNPNRAPRSRSSTPTPPYTGETGLVAPHTPILSSLLSGIDTIDRDVSSALESTSGIKFTKTSPGVGKYELVCVSRLCTDLLPNNAFQNPASFGLKLRSPGRWAPTPICRMKVPELDNSYAQETITKLVESVEGETKRRIVRLHSKREYLSTHVFT